MSYRLIDANAIAALLPEVKDMPCIYADLPSGLDGGHYDMRESDELQHENAELRELVADMWDWMKRARYDPAVKLLNEMSAIERRVENAGIEVKG